MLIIRGKYSKSIEIRQIKKGNKIIIGQETKEIRSLQKKKKQKTSKASYSWKKIQKRTNSKRKMSKIKKKTVKNNENAWKIIEIYRNRPTLVKK